MFFEIKSKNQTKKLAQLLYQAVFKEKIINNNALVLVLSGDLGAGKTTFARGFIRSAGIRKKIASPTFVLIKNYKLRIKNYGNYKNIYHIDLYRLKTAKDILDLGLKEILENPRNIVLIEWPEIIKRYLPKGVIWVEFEHGEKENERQIVIK